MLLVGFVTLDYVVLAVYLLAMLGIGVYFARGQETEDDYLMGGRNMNWFLVAMAACATLFSGVSVTGHPGYVFAHDNTMFPAVFGLAIGAPLVMLVLPYLTGLRLLSVYGYLEKRFSFSLRGLASTIFLVNKGVYVILVIYTASLLLDASTPLTFWQAAIVVGFISTGLTLLGGMKAVIWSDAVQLVIMIVGFAAVIGYISLADSEGVGALWNTAREAGRTRTFNWSLDWTSNTVWALIFFYATASALGHLTDQVFIQRLFAIGGQRAVVRGYATTVGMVIAFHGIFFVTGALLYGFYTRGLGHLPEEIARQGDKVLPYFISTQLPMGLAGLVLAALIAATISTATAVLNSLATVAINDFYARLWVKNRTPGHYVLVSRLLTLLFGVWGVAMAGCLVRYQSVVTGYVEITGLTLSPLGGIFFLGLFTRRATSAGVFVGALTGVAAALLVAHLNDVFPQAPEINVHWLYPTGALTTIAVGYLASLLLPGGCIHPKEFGTLEKE
jgi:SSS family transporter